MDPDSTTPRDEIVVSTDEWAVLVEQAERGVLVEAAIRAFLQELYVDLSDPRIEEYDFKLSATRRLRDVLGIVARRAPHGPDWWDNNGLGKDGFADHPFEGVGAHEGLGPCKEPKDWCHTDCGLPPQLHHPYAHFTDASGARVR